MFSARNYTEARFCPDLLLFLLLAVFAAPASAIDLFVQSPRGNEAIFGPVEVVFDVLSAAPVAGVEIFLDGELAGRVEAPPWKITIDVGEENRGHTIEIRATDAAGETASRTIETPPLTAQFELDIELQQLFVTVTRGGERVAGLEREDFEIRDDGVREEIVTFEGGDAPLTAVLLVDSSFSMRGEHLRAALAGARTFIASMRELDLAKVIVFSDRVLASTPFTGDPSEVGAAMEGVQAAGGTSINDHLYEALKELDQHQGRRLVILLSDGEDVESVLDMDDVRWKAGRSQALIYWIRPLTAALSADRPRTTSWRDAEAYRHEIETLERVVRESGGRIRNIDQIADAPAAFRDILAELREQYVLGYYPTQNRNDGSWHEVDVRVGGGLRARAREGYYDDEL